MVRPWWKAYSWHGPEGTPAHLLCEQQWEPKTQQWRAACGARVFGPSSRPYYIDSFGGRIAPSICLDCLDWVMKREAGRKVRYPKTPLPSTCDPQVDLHHHQGHQRACPEYVKGI